MKLNYVILAHGGVPPVVELSSNQFQQDTPPFIKSGLYTRLGYSSAGGSAKYIAARSYVLQSLQVMGHCDAYYGESGSEIWIAPAFLCRLPKADLPTAILTGARSLDTCKQVQDLATLTSGEITVEIVKNHAPVNMIPDTIIVQGYSEQALSSFANTLGINYISLPPAWTLVNWCASLHEMEEQLDYRHPDSLDWPRLDFHRGSLDFTYELTESKPRLSRYRNPVTTIPLHIFFREGLGAEIELSWGKYLFLNAMEITTTLYNEQNFKLCVPVNLPLPTILGRAICLCSGSPPTYKQQDGSIDGIHDWLVFSEVQPQIAFAALSKVGQTPLLTQSI